MGQKTEFDKEFKLRMKTCYAKESEPPKPSKMVGGAWHERQPIRRTHENPPMYGISKGWNSNRGQAVLGDHDHTASMSVLSAKNTRTGPTASPASPARSAAPLIIERAKPTL